MFHALLKYWRGTRGMSQLDVANAAEVSARHVSFLETGRAKPSREMVLRLADTLGVPLREQNAMLHAAGFSEQYTESSVEAALEGAVGAALERMLSQQEPYPLTVMDRGYRIVRMNQAAQRVLAHFIAEQGALEAPLNALALVFDPKGVRPYVQDWERVARALLSRLQRECVSRPGDATLTVLHSALCAYPGVPQKWREHDFALPNEPTLTLTLVRDDLRVAFLTTMTVFNAPQSVVLDELRIESYFPLDDATVVACERMGQASDFSV